MEIGVKSTVTATIYVTGGQGSPSGPNGWVARTITTEGFSELHGHGGGHFSRLLIVGTIAALDALPDGSTVSLISSDRNLIVYVIDRIDALVAGKVKSKKPLANKDLFSEVLRARNRHAQVTTEVVPWPHRDDEHEEAMGSLDRLLDAVKQAGDGGEPMPTLKARKARPQVKPDPDGGEDDGAASAHTAVDRADAPAKDQGAAMDVPW